MSPGGYAVGVVRPSSHLICLIVNLRFVSSLWTAVATFAGSITISCVRLH